MAVIKRLNEYGPAQNTRRVVNTPGIEVAGAATGRAMQELGSTINQIALQTEKAKQDSDIALSDIKVREDLDRVRREIENDPEIDPATYEQTWNAKSKEVLDRYGAPLKSNYASQVWQERAAGYQSDGVIKIRDTQRKRQIEGVKASMIEAGTAYERQAADIAVPEADVAKTRDAYEAILKTQYQNGLLSKDDVAAKMAQSEAVARAAKTTRVTSNIDALVDAGRIGEARAMLTNNASFIDPAQRDALDKALDASEFDQVTVTKSDELWTQARGDFGQFMQLAAKEQNAKQRVAIEARGAQLQQIEDKAESVRQDNLEDLMWAHVEKGGTIANGPTSVRAAIDPSRLSAIRAYETNRDAEATMGAGGKAAWKDRSADARFVLETMPVPDYLAGPESWSPDMKALYDNMTPDDIRAVNQDIWKRRQTGETSNAVDAVYQDLVNEAKRVAPAGWDVGSNAQSRSPEGVKFAGVLRKYATQISKDQGGQPISADDARKAVAYALREYDSKQSLPPDLATKELLSKQGMDPEAGWEIYQVLFQQLGRFPSGAEVKAAYDQVMGAQ